MELHREDPSSPSPTPITGACIRSLVKQLTTTKPKETMNNKDPCCASPSQNSRKNVKNQQQKKQVRRRLHTSKPYQERLLNMAEARKEIVTALKFHREAMKQATEEQQQERQQRRQQQQELLVGSLHNPSHISSFEQDVRSNSRRNPRIYPSCTSTFSNDFSYPPLFVPNSYTSFSPQLVVETENSNFTLPNQTLGLNLNLHDFNNLDATLINNNNNNNSSSSSSSPPLSFVTDKDGALDHFLVVVSGAPPDSSTYVQSIGISQGEGVSSIESRATTQVNGLGYHIAIDDEVMEEMRSLGDQYQMELNDTMNFVTSTLWFNFLKKMENDEIPHQVNSEDDALNHNVFDDLNAKESCYEQWSEDYFQYLNLPW